MKVLILTLGTCGDIQPFVALSRELTSAGHQAVLAAPHSFADLVKSCGVAFAGIDDGPLALMDSGSPVADVAAGGVGAKLAGPEGACHVHPGARGLLDGGLGGAEPTWSSTTAR